MPPAQPTAPGLAQRSAASYFGSGSLSNAAKSKHAQDSSKLAHDASAKTQGGDDWESHDRAADAHHNAAAAHQDAGNGTMAEMHKGQAAVHREKANAGRTLHYNAEDLSRTAHDLTTKAKTAAFGSDSKDPRGEKELHADAAQAHDRASKMHAMAGNERQAAYHGLMASDHAEAAQKI